MRYKPGHAILCLVLLASALPESAGKAQGSHGADQQSAKLIVVLFTGFDNRVDADSGMKTLLSSIKKDRDLKNVIGNVFTFYDPTRGFSPTAPWISTLRNFRLPHETAVNWALDQRPRPQDKIVLIGHSYGGNRARLFAGDLLLKGIHANALITIDPIDWENCQIAHPSTHCYQSEMKLPLLTPIPSNNLLSFAQTTDWPIRGYAIKTPVTVMANESHTSIDDSARVHQAILQFLESLQTEAKATATPQPKTSIGKTIKDGVWGGIKDGLGITEMELRKQLFQQLIADGQINKQDCVEMGETNPMKLLSTEKVDLNGDGIPEIKVSGEQGCAFQGARRGMQWLYRKTGNRYELLGSISAAEKIDLLNTSTNGYRDLNVIYPAGNNYPEFREVFRFDGRRYQEPKQQRSTAAKGSGAGAKPTANANTKPEQGDWATFWPTFREAVQKRDRASLKSMMSASFEWAGDGQVSSVQALRNLDQGLVSWQRLLISVNSGVVNCKSKDGSCWNFSGRQAKRTIKANCLVFELGVDGHWKWVRLIGD